MNKVFKIVWSHSLNKMVVVSELAKSGGKQSSKTIGAISFSFAALFAGSVMAAPVPAGENKIPHGKAKINTVGDVTNITQSTPKVIINWNSFNIDSAETVNFIQTFKDGSANDGAIALNRIKGDGRSMINGTLNANGHVFLVNTNGVTFGKGAEVDVGGLVVSTLSISNNNYFRCNGVCSSS